MKKIKQVKSGISLIVLVITIIVMIILAAAIILSLDGSNIIGRAKEAQKSSDIATAKEIVALAKSEWAFEKVDGYDSAKEYAEAKLEEAGYKLEGNGGIVLSSTSNAISTIYVGSDNRQAIIPEGFTASIFPTEDTVTEGLVIYDATAAELSKVSHEEAMEKYNQFVWVPVDDMNLFKRTTTYNGTITDPGDDYSEPASNVEGIDPATFNPDEEWVDTPITLSLSNDLTGEWKEWTAMMVSVAEYNGFYIGRYEAGIKDDIWAASAIVCKKGMEQQATSTWGLSMSFLGDEWLEAGWSMVTGAREMYKKSNSVVSTMCYGVQWDSALQFIYKTDPIYPTITDSEKGFYEYDEDGNVVDVPYENGVMPTGFYAVNNIYDMAGNPGEYTMEAFGTRERVIRGGLNLSEPACLRTASEVSNGNVYNISFRVALYIK